MKITETIERDCCHLEKDLKPFRPDVYKKKPAIKFCQHCGRLWEWERKAGEMDYGYEPIDFPENE